MDVIWSGSDEGQRPARLRVTRSNLVRTEVDEVTAEELSKRQARFFKAMAHPKRISILRALTDGEKSVTELVRLIDATQPNTSQHLAIMRRSGVIQARRSGSSVYYSVADRQIADACESLRLCMSEKLVKAQIALAPIV